MRKFIPLLFILLLTGKPGHANGADWTAADTGLQLTFSTLLIADWTQTLHCSRNPSSCVEGGAARHFIGQYPSKRDVNKYFAAGLIGHGAVSYLLSKPYRTVWQSIFIVCEYDVVQSSRKFGAGISLHF